MRYLVTGGCGFIGSHLTETLLERGHHVTVIDDLSTGRRANLDAVADHPALRVTIGSCSDGALMAELVESVEVVFHLAAAVGVKLVVESPVRTIETNMRTTEAVLTAAAKSRTPVLLASTSEVYGKSEALPFREDADLVMGPTDRGRWSYACSKALAEFLANAYARERGVPVAIVRLFNTVGPRQTGRYGMVIPTFVRQALAGEDITVYGDGTQARCFTHVTDVVRALIGIVDGRHFGMTFNVGSTDEISMHDLAKQVREMADSSSRLVFVPYERAYVEGFEDMRRRVPDCTRIQSTIGWRPTLALPRILRDVISSVGAA
jgi:UDP-glucose 4-epimerase